MSIARKFQSRKFLLALFGQATGLVVLFYPEHASTIEAAATNVGALVLMGLTAAGWIAGESYIDREAVAGEAVDRQADRHLAQQREFQALADGQRQRQRQTPMGLVPLAAPLLGAAMLLGAAGGCAVSPQDRWHQAQDGLTTARNAIMAQHAAGNISDAELVRLDEFEKAARTALEAAEPIATDPDAADDADLIWHLDLAERMLERLIDYLGTPETHGSDATESEASDAGSGPSATGDPGQRHHGERPRAAGVHSPAGGDDAGGRPARRRAA